MFWRKKDSAVEVAVDSVVNAMLKRPDDFEIGEHTMKDKETGYEYWISVGFGNVERPFKLGFGFIHGLRFRKAVKGLKTHQLKTKTDKG